MITRVYKSFASGESSSIHEVGKTDWLLRDIGDCVAITYHEPQGTGDKHYCDCYYDSGIKFRVFDPETIEWKEEKL